MNSKPRALIIEDQVEIATMYRIALEAANFETFAALSLVEAFELLKGRRPPDVVFLDLNLNEEEKAHYVVQQIQAIKAYNRNMVLIVISGVLTPDLIEIASLQGADHTKEKMDMVHQVDIWNMMAHALEKTAPDIQSRLETTLGFLKAAAKKLSLLILSL